MAVEFGRATPGAPGVISGQTTVTTAGTAVRLSTADIDVVWVQIRALDANTGIVAVGNDGSNDVTTANGYQLYAQANDAALTLGAAPPSGIGLREIWVDSAANSEGVAWIAVRANIIA